MPRSNKAAAIAVAVIGVLVAVFFVCSMIKGGFSFTSVLGILLGLSAAGWQLRNLFYDNETEVDEEWY